VPLLIAIKSAPAPAENQMLDLTSLSDDDLKSVSLTFERTRCYGSCPAYNLSIHGDGSVEYVGKNNVKAKGAHTGRIELASIKRLMSEFSRAKFFSLKEEYSEEKCFGRLCTDMPTAVTELKVKGLSHRVRHYYGCGEAPRALFDLESGIDKAVNSRQWTGDVSRQGPYGTTCWENKPSTAGAP